MQSETISVLPSQSLSLQFYNYQNQHWIIVTDIAHTYLNNEPPY